MVSNTEPIYRHDSDSPINNMGFHHSPSSLTKKRKRDAASENKLDDGKKPHSKKKTPRLDEDFNPKLGINKSFSHMDDLLIADYISQQTRKFQTDLSPVELEDRYITAAAIRDTVSWELPRDLDNLPRFLQKFSRNPSNLWSASEKFGTPHTIIVAGAGLRAANLARVMRQFQNKDTPVAKLFAKHIKIKDAVKFLKTTRTGIAVGTPTRLNDLIDEGALVVDEVERIVIDASHIDQKKRGVLEMRETHTPLIQWLNRKEFKGRLGHAIDGIDLLFY